ncbi:MAG: Sua5/YciO/YrdC/YwlC family protein [Gammaproteobacteria bacterium]|nr:Sua5/YciO/YrdC/YwlC family protein [Gammaproteobacteria bacterium]
MPKASWTRTPSSRPNLPAKPVIHPWHLRLAVRTVLGGGLIAYPTESVYGLGCDPLNPLAVFRLLALKKRSADKGLILISDNFERLRPYLAQIPQTRLKPALDSWPGPVTWLLPAAADLPFWIRGKHSTVAVRVTDHPVAAALCHACGRPLISTSANLSSRPPARNALQVRSRCGSAIDLILHGETGDMKRPTPIRDLFSGRISRR